MLKYTTCDMHIQFQVMKKRQVYINKHEVNGNLLLLTLNYM